MSTAAAVYPTPWVLLASLLAGVALARAARVSRRSRDPEAARTRKWVVFSLCLSGSVAAWLLAVFVPGAEKIADLKYPLYFLACTLACGVGFRFPKTAGLALVVAGIVAVTVGFLFSTSVSPYTAETEIGDLSVYGVEGGSVDVQMRLPAYPRGYVRLKGDHIAPMVTSITFDDLWPWLGWRSWYRVEGVTAFSLSAAPEEGTVVVWSESSLTIERPPGVSGVLYSRLLEHARRIPGVRIVHSELLSASSPDASGGGHPEQLREYSLRLRLDGSVLVAGASP